MNRKFLFIPMLLLAATVTGGALTAQKVKLSNRATKIKEWGYSLKLIEGWNSLAAQAGVRNVVGRWKLGLDEYEQRGDYDGYRAGSYCELTIIRFPPTVATGGKPEDKPDAEPAPEPEENSKSTLSASLAKRLNPKTIDEFIEAVYEGADKRWVRGPIKGSKTPGEMIEFGSSSSAVCLGAFKKDGVEWLLIYEAFEETYKKTWRELYIESLKSFEVFGPPADDMLKTSRLDPSKLKGDEKRSALKNAVAGLPGWYCIDTPNYVLMSNSKERSFVESLAKDIQAARDKVYTKMFKARNKEESISPVRILDTQKEYYQYGGSPSSAGYFNPGSGELVLFTKFDYATKTDSKSWCRSVMFHEAFHQYVHYAVGDVSPHSWFNEGHGDYFAGMSMPGGSPKFSTFEWRTGYLKDHMRQGNDLIPLRTLIRMPQSEYYSNAGLKYSQGWALIYYLREITKNKAEQLILDKYFTYLADNIEAFKSKKKDKDDKPDEGGSIPGIPGIRIIDFEDAAKVERILSEAVDHAFDGIDIEKLQEQFEEWVKKTN